MVMTNLSDVYTEVQKVIQNLSEIEEYFALNEDEHLDNFDKMFNHCCTSRKHLLKLKKCLFEQGTRNRVSVPN